MTHDRELRAIARATRRQLSDVIEHFTERAAIREHDGGMPRADAERAAVEDIRRTR